MTTSEIQITDFYDVVTLDEDKHDDEGSIEAGTYVVGGEYASEDCAEVLIRVHFALDDNGNPVTEHVARLIASVLSHQPVELQRKDDLIAELRKRDEVHQRTIVRLQRQLNEARVGWKTSDEAANTAQAERNKLIGLACDGSPECPSPMHVDGCFRSPREGGAAALS